MKKIIAAKDVFTKIFLIIGFLTIIIGGSWLTKTSASKANQQTSIPIQERVKEIDDSPVFTEFDAFVNQYADKNFTASYEQNQVVENLAVERKQLLKELIEINPQAALEKAIPAEIFNRLPQSITDYSEKRVSAYGDFYVYVLDKINPSTGEPAESHTERLVVIGDVTYKAVVFGRREAMPTKLNIPLQGIVIDNVMVVDESPARKLDSTELAERDIDSSKLNADGVTAEIGGKIVNLASQSELDNFVREQIEWESKIGPVRPEEMLKPEELASSWTEGIKKVLIIRVDFSDRPGEPIDFQENLPLTEARALSKMNNEVNPFFVDNSYNKTSLQTTVTTLVRMPKTQSFYAQGTNYYSMYEDARTAARAAGFEANNFNLDIVAFSNSQLFPFAGLSYVGTKGMLLSFFRFEFFTHELGHNYGLHHANLWRTTDGSPIGQGTDRDGEDFYDRMGPGNDSRFHFNARYKRNLDWLTEANVQTVTNSGDYRIFAQDSPSPGGMRVLKIKKDNTKNYWVEFRQQITNISNIMNGATVRWDKPNSNQTQLLDMTPNTSSVGTGAQDAPLLIGQSFYDSSSQMRITVLGKGNTSPQSLDVRVELPQNCSYSLSVTNANIGASGGSDSVNVIAPSNCNWTATSNASWLTITGGSSGNGNGTVSYFVQQNTSITARTGTITLNGSGQSQPVVFTVTQTAAVSSGIQFSAANYSVSEAGGTAAITITRTGGTNPVSVNYATSNGTAIAGSDYNSTSGTLNFVAGETNKTFNVSIINDSNIESNETVNLTLGNLTGGATLGSPGTAVLTIIDNDSCTYSINPTGAEPTATATTSNTVAVTAPAGCQWTASTTDSWITLTAGNSGTGNGILTYSVSSNNGAARAGVIIVAGKTFTVLQNSGFPCSVTSIIYGQTVPGNFSSSDCTFFGNYNDVYTFNGTAGDRIAISSSFSNANLQLHSNVSGIVDLTSTANATWFYTLPTTSAYTLYTSPSVKFNQPDGAGAYTLSLIRVTQTRKAFDFDGDGKTDVSIFRPSVGEWWYLRSSDEVNRAFQFGNGSDKLIPADYTGDGKTDIAFFRPQTNEWFILRSEDNSFYSFPFGASGDIPAPADYDGDGKADAAVFRPSNQTWFISRSSGGTTIQQFGIVGDVPTVADYDGDGKADIAIYRPSLGQWWLLRSSAGTIAYQFGAASDNPVQGDYTGDGKTDVAFFRPSTSEWFILRSENNSFYSFPFGTTNDVPSPGDYDGDGKFDAAVFRPSNNTWFVQRTTAGTLIQSFGQAGDKPVPSAFVP